MTVRYHTKDHEWVELKDQIVTIGITNFAQQQLGDVTFVELPEPGAHLAKGDEAAVIESVKAASEIYAPLDGTVTEINEELGDNPALVNGDAENDGWFFRMEIDDGVTLDHLMDQKAYAEFIDSL